MYNILNFYTIQGSFFRLKAHEKHIHEGGEKLMCDTDGCTKSFITKDDLKRHQRIHTDVKRMQFNTLW